MIVNVSITNLYPQLSSVNNDPPKKRSRNTEDNLGSDVRVCIYSITNYCIS